jgi:hypothetical protein
MTACASSADRLLFQLGLFMPGQDGNYLDDIQERYERLISSSQNFVINQFGLSAFKYNSGKFEASCQ